MLRAGCVRLPGRHVQATPTVVSVAHRAQSSSNRREQQDLMDRFSDREVDLRRKGDLFRNRQRTMRSQDRVVVDMEPPDVIKNLKVRVKFAEKMLSHLTQTEVKIEMRMARPLDTDSAPIEAKSVTYLRRKRRDFQN